MTKYRIPISWQTIKHYDIEAETLQDAVNEAVEQFLKEPCQDGDYLEDSFEVDPIIEDDYPNEEYDVDKAVERCYKSE